MTDNDKAALETGRLCAFSDADRVYSESLHTVPA